MQQRVSMFVFSVASQIVDARYNELSNYNFSEGVPINASKL